jgi:hypothetical protein
MEGVDKDARSRGESSVEEPKVGEGHGLVRCWACVEETHKFPRQERENQSAEPKFKPEFISSSNLQSFLEGGLFKVWSLNPGEILMF